MDELLKKLLESEVLTEETKTEIKTEIEAALKKQLDEAIESARADVTAELSEQWVADREKLINAIDAKLEESLKEELAELMKDIENFRDLEAEFAENLVEAKHEMEKQAEKDMVELIEKLDTFMEIRLTAEVNELKEDFEAAKKARFGQSVFEAFVDEFRKHYAGDDTVERRLTEAERQLEDTTKALHKAERRAAEMSRQMTMGEVLSPLSGRTREVMEAILKNVETSMLKEAYQTYIGRVLKETAVNESSEKENPVLAEGNEEPAIAGVIKNGDDRVLLSEQYIHEETKDTKQTITENDKQYLRRLAGLA